MDKNCQNPARLLARSKKDSKLGNTASALKGLQHCVGAKRFATLPALSDGQLAPVPSFLTLAFDRDVDTGLLPGLNSSAAL